MLRLFLLSLLISPSFSGQDQMQAQQGFDPSQLFQMFGGMMKQNQGGGGGDPSTMPQGGGYDQFGGYGQQGYQDPSMMQQGSPQQVYQNPSMPQQEYGQPGDRTMYPMQPPRPSMASRAAAGGRNVLGGFMKGENYGQEGETSMAGTVDTKARGVFGGVASRFTNKSSDPEAQRIKAEERAAAKQAKIERQKAAQEAKIERQRLSQESKLEKQRLKAQQSQAKRAEAERKKAMKAEQSQAKRAEAERKKAMKAEQSQAKKAEAERKKAMKAEQSQAKKAEAERKK